MRLLRLSVAVALIAAIAGVVVADLNDVHVPLRDDPVIDYANKASNDPVARLNRQLDAGTAVLRFDSIRGFLPSVLRALNIPIESQMLVFSKTSIQAFRISPHSPRALYFNDSVVVGWVPGGFVEIASLDPQQGVMFYIINTPAGSQPRFMQNAGGAPVCRAC
jgi:hypothetical protein